MSSGESRTEPWRWMLMRRMKSSPIFLLMLRREREMDPVVARRAGSGVVAVIVVDSRSSKRDVWGN